MLILLWEGYLPKLGKLSKSDGKKIILRTNNRNNTTDNRRCAKCDGKSSHGQRQGELKQNDI
jgi:PHP family Zn ribbon phosphoesterase